MRETIRTVGAFITAVAALAMLHRYIFLPERRTRESACWVVRYQGELFFQHYCAASGELRLDCADAIFIGPGIAAAPVECPAPQPDRQDQTTVAER
jgi:hypothetical protein